MCFVQELFSTCLIYSMFETASNIFHLKEKMIFRYVKIFTPMRQFFEKKTLPVHRKLLDEWKKRYKHCKCWKIQFLTGKRRFVKYPTGRWVWNTIVTARKLWKANTFHLSNKRLQLVDLTFLSNRINIGPSRIKRDMYTFLWMIYFKIYNRTRWFHEKLN